MGKKFLLPSSDLTEKNSLPQRQIWIKSSADKNINYISKPKKNCQNAASRFCDYIIISRGCSSHFLDIWIRTNPLCQLKKNLPETLFFQFFIAFGGVTLYIFLAGDSVIHLVKSRDWLESKIVLYYGICGPFFNNFQISCQWLFFWCWIIWKKKKKTCLLINFISYYKKPSGKYQQPFNIFNSKGSFHTLGHLRSKVSDQNLFGQMNKVPQVFWLNWTTNQSILF